LRNSSIEDNILFRGNMESPLRLSNGLALKDLGSRIRDERTRRSFSLEDLARISGVSRSMMSAVERGFKVPSVLVLDRIATGLGTSIARLVGEERSDRIILLRQDRQEVAQDPSGWERRILSPVLPGVEFEFMRTTIRAGVDAGSFSPHSPGSREYVAIEKGALLLTIGGQEFHLNSGDSIYYAGDCIHSFANPGKKDCIYYLVMDVSGDLLSAAHVPLSPRKRRASQ
jgi:transcriptional regulator with XRE-family HTH domain